jgi:hypothetical protein
MNKKVYVKYKNLGEELGDDFKVFSENSKASPESASSYDLTNGQSFEIDENAKYINVLPYKYDFATHPDDTEQKYLEDIIANLENGLVSFHRFSDETDSINYTSLSNNGGVTFGQGFFTKSSAAYFNGLNFLKTNYSIYNTSVSDLNDFSISFYFYKNEFGSQSGYSLVDGTNSSATKTSFYIRESGSGLVFGVRNPNNTFQQIVGVLTDNQTIEPYTSYHVVAVRSSGILKLYINGEKVAESTTPITNSIHPTSDNNFAIGAKLNGTQKFAGAIGSLGIWNRGLTEDEIFNLYVNASYYEEDALPYIEIPIAELNVSEKFNKTSDLYNNNPVYKNKMDYYTIWKSSNLKKWVMTYSHAFGIEPPVAPYHNTSFYSPALGEIPGFGLYKKYLETQIGENINDVSLVSSLNNFKDDFVYSPDGSTLAFIKRNWETTPGSGVVSSVIVYKFINNEWTPQPSPLENLSSSDISFGIPVAISLNYDGTVLAVSTDASYSIDEEQNCQYGSIFIFEYESFSESWIQKGTEINGSKCDSLGLTLQLNLYGDLLMVGSTEFISTYKFSPGEGGFVTASSETGSTINTGAWEKIDAASIELNTIA